MGVLLFHRNILISNAVIRITSCCWTVFENSTRKKQFRIPDSEEFFGYCLFFPSVGGPFINIRDYLLLTRQKVFMV
jgi:hypothetical protein